MLSADDASWSARFGLTPEELTPRVRLALTLLGDEIAGLQESVRRAEVEAERDALTGVLNRRGFLRELNRATAMLQRHESQAAVLFVDLDGFKLLNDQFGHATGDAALVHVARFLETHVRIEDRVGRIGGDEFAVLLHRADAAQAQAKAELLSRLLPASPLQHQERQHVLTASFGAAALQPGDAPELAIARADEAMYAAKQAVRRKEALAALA